MNPSEKLSTYLAEIAPLARTKMDIYKKYPAIRIARLITPKELELIKRCNEAIDAARKMHFPNGFFPNR